MWRVHSTDCSAIITPFNASNRVFRNSRFVIRCISSCVYESEFWMWILKVNSCSFYQFRLLPNQPPDYLNAFHRFQVETLHFEKLHQFPSRLELRIDELRREELWHEDLDMKSSNMKNIHLKCSHPNFHLNFATKNFAATTLLSLFGTCTCFCLSLQFYQKLSKCQAMWRGQFNALVHLVLDRVTSSGYHFGLPLCFVWFHLDFPVAFSQVLWSIFGTSLEVREFGKIR